MDRGSKKRNYTEVYAAELFVSCGMMNPGDPRRSVNDSCSAALAIAIARASPEFNKLYAALHKTIEGRKALATRPELSFEVTFDMEIFSANTDKDVILGSSKRRRIQPRH
jgi:hypothetical protein